MAGEDNGHGKTRLDRIEGVIEALANRQVLIEDEFARLLKAQVVMVDAMTTMSDTMTAVERRIDERQRQSDDRLNALIAVVDDLIRRGPLQPPRP
jgi:hypothetical protein